MISRMLGYTTLAAALAFSSAVYAQGIGDPCLGPNGEGPQAANGPGARGSDHGDRPGAISCGWGSRNRGYYRGSAPGFTYGERY